MYCVSWSSARVGVCVAPSAEEAKLPVAIVCAALSRVSVVAGWACVSGRVGVCVAIAADEGSRMIPIRVSSLSVACAVLSRVSVVAVRTCVSARVRGVCVASAETVRASSATTAVRAAMAAKTADSMSRWGLAVGRRSYAGVAVAALLLTAAA